MKYKIKKMQGGGFASFTPISLSAPTPPVQPTQQVEKTEEGSNSILDKELYKELTNKGGLFNDVNLFVDKLIELEQGPNAYLNKNNRTSALKLISEINALKQMKESWTNTVQTAQKNGGLNEVAVSSFGQMYVKDTKGKIKSVSTEDYIKNGDKYQVMTVSDLMNARQYDPRLAYDTSLFSVGENSVGLNSIITNIKELVSSLGVESVKDEGYYSKKNLVQEISSKFGTRKPTQQEMSAIEDLYTKVSSTPGEFFKVTRENESQRNKLNIAFDYIWDAIGRPAQLKLKASAALQGETNPKKILEQMLYTNTDFKESTSIEPKDAAAISGSSKGDVSLKAYQMFHKDLLTDPSNSFIFNDPKLGVLFKGYVGASGPLLTENDEPIPMTTLDNVVVNFGYNRIVDQSKIFFGDKKVDPINRKNIMFDGETVQKVYMPTDSEGKPDYEEFKHFKEVYSIYEANKQIWSPKDAERHFSENGYNLKIDDINGEKVIMDNKRIKPFLVMYGYTNDATDLIDGNNEDIIRKLSSAEEDRIVPILEAAWTIGSGKNKVNFTPEKPGWDFGEDYYKGLITIPYRKEATAIVDAICGQGPTHKKASINDVQWNIRDMNNLGNARILTQNYGN